MKALVFGAGGQVGRALLATRPNAAEVRGLTRVECDIADQNAVRRAITETQPDVVFNAAAYTAVDRAESEPHAVHRLNGVAPGVIAMETRAAGARFVHLSTDFVFGESGGVPLRPKDQTSPRSVYGRTKLAGEMAVIDAYPAALIVRTAWVYAPFGQNFVNTMLRLMREREEVRVVADQVGTPTYAPSLAGALWRLVASNAAGVHHFTDAGVASWFDFAVAIAEEAMAASVLTQSCRVVPITTADYRASAPRPSYSVLDKSETWELLSGAPPHWRANLRRNLEELKLHG